MKHIVLLSSPANGSNHGAELAKVNKGQTGLLGSTCECQHIAPAKNCVEQQSRGMQAFYLLLIHALKLDKNTAK